jgi:hypothetical protein
MAPNGKASNLEIVGLFVQRGDQGVDATAAQHRGAWPEMK